MELASKSPWVVLAVVLLAIVFAWAAGAKLVNRSETVAGFEALGLPKPTVTFWLVVALELAVALLLLIAPTWGGVLAFAVLAGFTVFLVGLVRDGRPVACRCFGQASTAPVSSRTLVRNGVLLVLATVAALS